MLEKRKSRRSKLIGWAVFIFVFSPLVAGFIYLIWYSPVFVIKGVSLLGAEIPQEEVNDLLGGNPVGKNILFWREGEGHVLDPRFSSFDIKRNYFKRTIEVTVSEREKDMVWCFESNEACYWIDRSGFIFSHAPFFSGNLIVSITDLRQTPLEIGSYVLNSKMNDILHQILKILEKLNIQTDNIRLENIKLRELIVKASGGPRIIFSLDIDPSFTETAIESLKNTAAWGQIKSLNLTVPDRAYPSY